MEFKPFNRYILIEVVEEEEQEAALVVLPTNYKKPKAPYLTGKVIDKAIDSRLDVSKGDHIVFERRMLNILEIDNKTHYLVLENYVFGRYGKWN